MHSSKYYWQDLHISVDRVIQLHCVKTYFDFVNEHKEYMRKYISRLSSLVVAMEKGNCEHFARVVRIWLIETSNSRQRTLKRRWTIRLTDKLVHVYNKLVHGELIHGKLDHAKVVQGNNRTLKKTLCGIFIHPGRTRSLSSERTQAAWILHSTTLNICWK